MDERRRVRLKANWPAGEFRRAIRDAKGNVQRVLTFPRGIGIELSIEEYEAIKGDLGTALQDLTEVPTLYRAERSHTDDIEASPPRRGRKRTKERTPPDVREDAVAQDAPPAVHTSEDEAARKEADAT